MKKILAPVDAQLAIQAYGAMMPGVVIDSGTEPNSPALKIAE